MSGRGRVRLAFRGRARRVGAAALGVAFGVVALLGFAAGLVAPSLASASSSGGTLSPATHPAVAPGQAGLTLGISTLPSSVCLAGVPNCPAGTDTSRVTLTATANGGATSWPAVQVAFVLETTNYDGAGCSVGCGGNYEPCITQNPADGFCEEGNGPQFLMYHAQQIADEIQASNPRTAVSFALIDGFATNDYLDDGDDAQYHVDTSNFIPVQEFGQVALQVKANLFHCDGDWTFCDSGMADNFLHSDSITELYGAINGFGLNWSANAHHVIVLLTSSAPRASGFAENYGATFDSYGYGVNNVYTPYNPALISPTCEPSYPFPAGPSPPCEGWVASQDGNPADSIAALTKTAKNCVDAIGGTCTVDVVDLWTCTDDPYCLGYWPNDQGAPTQNAATWQGIVRQDVTHILLAGCELSAATGGTWEGPSWFTCPNGQQGTLQYVPHGALDDPTTDNPTLFDALTRIGFGPVANDQVAAGTGVPIFQFLPVGNISFAPASRLDLSTSCARNGLPFATCDPGTLYLHGSVAYLAWNWSTVSAENVMLVGDTWSASFNVVDTGPPSGEVPVDACLSVYCSAAGSGPVAGLYSWADYYLCTTHLGCGTLETPVGAAPLGARTLGTPSATNPLPQVLESFPLAQLDVEGPAAVPVPPSGFPSLFAPTPPALPGLPSQPFVVPPQGFLAQGGLPGSFSLQASAAGLIGAGFTTIAVKNRPIAVRVGAYSGRRSRVGSRFESAPRGPSRGRP
jgi:hypothetical protein